MTAEKGFLCYIREGSGERITVLANAGEGSVQYPLEGALWDILSDRAYNGVVAPGEAMILTDKAE